MKIILKDDVKKLGKAGEIVSVAPGYARNYLLPKDLACIATTGNKKNLAQELNSKKGKERRIIKDLEYQAEQLSSQPIVIKASVGEAGKLFGSVTVADIEKALEKKDLKIDKRKLELAEPIKLVGEYKVNLKLHSQVTATLTIKVEPDENSKIAESPKEDNEEK